MWRYIPHERGTSRSRCPGRESTKKEDIQGFVERLLFITKDDLRLVCKNCNSTLAYAEKQGISFEEAMAVKKAIDIVKQKKDKQFLEERGIIPCIYTSKA